MTVSVTLIDINTQNFEALVDKVNEVANLVSNSAVTANTTQGLTTGNVYVDGIFSATTLSANTAFTGQADAIKLAIARALVEVDPENKPALRAKGLMTRDSRSVERKKAGQPKARKKTQFSKR